MLARSTPALARAFERRFTQPLARPGSGSESASLGSESASLGSGAASLGAGSESASGSGSGSGAGAGSVVAAAAAAWLLVACGHRPPVPVTVLVEGSPAQVAEVRASLGPTSVAGLVLRHAELALPDEQELGAAAVAAAYQDFIAGDGSRCRERLAGVDLPRLLAHRQRAHVARALLLDARCAEGLGASAEADARFAEFASYDLELAEAEGVLSPALRPRFDRALAAAGTAPRARLSVEGTPGGRVMIDGRLAGCTAPCSPVVRVGAHVISVEADGAALAWRKLVVESPRAGAAAPSVSLPRAPASATEAAAQWRARVGAGFAPDDAAGLALLPVMVNDDRVAYLRVRSDPARPSAPPTLAGALAARSPERAAPITTRGQRLSLEAAPELMRSLAIDAELFEAPRPRWFWPVLVGSVIATAAITAALLYEPDIRTEVSF